MTSTIPAQVQTVLSYVNQFQPWANIVLRAEDMGENIQECSLHFEPTFGVCKFVAFINVEAENPEYIQKRYGSSNQGILAFIAEYGPLNFVPKVLDYDKYENLINSGSYDALFLDHNEDFISPYAPTENLFILNEIRSILDTRITFENFGASQEINSFLNNLEFEPTFSTVGDIEYALTPYLNSFTQLPKSSQVTVENLYITGQHNIEIHVKIRATQNLRHESEDRLELGYIINAEIDHANKKITKMDAIEAFILVLSFNDDLEDFLIYNQDQWFSDCFSNMNINDVFDVQKLTSSLKDLCVKSNIYKEAIETQIFK